MASAAAGPNGTLARALEGCWDGLLVTDVGRSVTCGGTIVMIGQFCDACPTGRLRLSDGEVSCNSCENALGPAEFLPGEEEVPVSVASAFINGECATVQAYTQMNQRPVARLKTGRPFWVMAQQGGRSGRRVAWEGQKCPVCAYGQLRFRGGPEARAEALVCSSTGCPFRLEVVSDVDGPTAEESGMWRGIALEPQSPPWLMRMNKIREAFARDAATPEERREDAHTLCRIAFPGSLSSDKDDGTAGGRATHAASVGSGVGDGQH